jgi:hypothetical protein
MATLSYHYLEYAVLYYLLLSLLGMIVLYIMKKNKEKNQLPTVTHDT